MAEILPGIHLVEDVDPSTHVYLLRDKGSSWTLVDGGLPGSEAPIGAYLTKIGAKPHDVKTILVTHCHNDHTGALVRLKHLTGARIYAHWLEAAFIAGKPKYDGPGVAPQNPIEVDERLKDGDRVEAGGGLVAYHTPGHTPGHTCYYAPERKLLFCGDLFFGVPGLVLTTPEYTQHMLSAQISARRMTELPVESILSYHGGPFPQGAGKELAALVRSF